MFTKEQINYMKKIGLTMDFSKLSDDDWCEIEDAVGDRLSTHGFDRNYKPTQDGIMCESIIDQIPK